jgi:hypothetical protein
MEQKKFFYQGYFYTQIRTGLFSATATKPVIYVEILMKVLIALLYDIFG